MPLLRLVAPALIFSEAGHNPVCVDACPMRAIEFGDIDELRKKHPDAVTDLPSLPSSSYTHPNVAIKPSESAKRSDHHAVVL